MRFLLMVLIAFSFTACGKSKHDGKPLVQIIAKTSDKGYQQYIASCYRDIKDETVCKCQADLLDKYLEDKDIMLIAEAGTAASNGDKAKLDNIMKNRPDLVAALKKVSAQAEECARR